MVHSFSCRQSLQLIVSQKLVQEVDGLLGNQVLVLAMSEPVPTLLRVSAEDIVEPDVEVDGIFIDVVVELFCSQNSHYLHQLVVVVVALEEWFLPEDHASHHTAQ